MAAQARRPKGARNGKAVPPTPSPSAGGESLPRTATFKIQVLDDLAAELEHYAHEGTHGSGEKVLKALKALAEAESIFEAASGKAKAAPGSGGGLPWRAPGLETIESAG